MFHHLKKKTNNNLRIKKKNHNCHVISTKHLRPCLRTRSGKPIQWGKKFQPPPMGIYFRAIPEKFAHFCAFPQSKAVTPNINFIVAWILISATLTFFCRKPATRACPKHPRNRSMWNHLWIQAEVLNLLQKWPMSLYKETASVAATDAVQQTHKMKIRRHH